MSEAITARWTKVWDIPHPTKKVAERHLAIVALGTVEAIRRKQISAADAWENGLNLKTYIDLKSLRADRRLLDLWEWAMELPQVARLGEEAIEQSLVAIEKLASSLLSRPTRAKRVQPRRSSATEARGFKRVI